MQSEKEKNYFFQHFVQIAVDYLKKYILIFKSTNMAAKKKTKAKAKPKTKKKK